MSSNYESAVSTKLVATRCAVCSRKLRDAMSVEMGIGPECRSHYNYEAPEAEVNLGEALVRLDRAQELGWAPGERAQKALQVDEVTGRVHERRVCNALVHAIALDAANHERNEHMVEAIWWLGYRTLAWRLACNLRSFIEKRIAAEELAQQRAEAEARLRADREALQAKMAANRRTMPTVAQARVARGATISVEVRPAWLYVTCENLSRVQFAAYRQAMRVIGATWDRSQRCNAMPRTSARREQLWRVLQNASALRGVLVRGAKGERVLGEMTKRSAA